MASELDVTYLDRSMETSTAGFRGVDLTAANFTAQAGLMDALVGAVQAIVLGTKITDTRKASVVKFAKVKPTNPYAQRENKWLVRYSDSVDANGNGTLEIPTPNLNFLNEEGTFLDLSSTEGAAFKTAFEAYQRSRLGNTVVLDSVQYVGRNN